MTRSPLRSTARRLRPAAHRPTAVTVLTAVLAAALTAGVCVVGPAGPAAAAAAAPGTGRGAPTAVGDRAGTGPLTNLAHLDELRTRVAPPAQSGHTTYRLDRQPAIGVLWTYAEPGADGGWRLLGGGEYDPATDTYGQGAFNADDISRAAVVYLRHWRSTGSDGSRAAAADLLRGLTYLQTASGPNAGNVVLWMQPDGRLNPSADPPELPDPSDSGASYWLARTIWALGEGYAAFRDRDPQFAGFLRARLDLAIAAVDRQVLDRSGSFLQIDGARLPAWLVADGGDASAEAVLGLAAYVQAGGPTSARTALTELSAGIALLADGDAQHWPFGAVLPWALSRSVWHAWGSQMPAALARASAVLGSPRLAAVAATDSGTFDPWLLTSGGPDNGRLPTRIDGSQIAYGVDSRLQSLLATAAVTGAAGPRRLAGITAAWFFGANTAGVPAYDPQTGITVDGIGADGSVNRNSGAESTIHGLLAMLALDQNPDVARQARTATVVGRDGTLTLQAEDATLAVGAVPVAPDPLWTGESQYGGTGYVALGDGARVTLSVPPGDGRLVLPVLDLRPGSTAVTTFRAGGRVLGTVRSGAVGPQGDSPAAGALLPVTLERPLAAGATEVTASTTASGGDVARLDAVLLEPLVSRYQLADRGDQAGRGTTLLRSAADQARPVRVDLLGAPATVEAFDGHGRLVRSWTVWPGPDRRLTVVVPAGGFTVLRS